MGIFGIILTVIYLTMGNHGMSPRKLAKIRVRIDDSNRRQAPEPSEKEFDGCPDLDWLIIAIPLFILMLLSAFR
jgi:hypothetical protein